MSLLLVGLPVIHYTLRYRESDQRYLDIETLEIRQDYKTRQADFWNNLLPR